MNLTPREKDKLLIAMAAIVARRRLERGVKLNHPEAVALITDFVVEGARDGRSVAELMEAGAHVVAADQVMDGDRVDDSRHPGRGDVPRRHQARHRARSRSAAPTTQLIPGETLAAPGDIVMNDGRDTITLEVANSGDRPIQVGSHYHFFETNPALKFDRARRARASASTSPPARRPASSPARSANVRLVALAGKRQAIGFRQEVMGKV